MIYRRSSHLESSSYRRERKHKPFYHISRLEFELFLTQDFVRDTTVRGKGEITYCMAKVMTAVNWDTGSTEKKQVQKKENFYTKVLGTCLTTSKACYLFSRCNIKQIPNIFKICFITDFLQNKETEGIPGFFSAQNEQS